MQVIFKKITEIQPYEKNPRYNDDAVEYVANSIKEFGFQQPIVVDSEGVIIAGHTRYKAAERLELESVPVVIADELSEEQVRAYRLADNKTAERSFWNFNLLEDELAGIDNLDMSLFDFKDLDENISYIDDLMETELVDSSLSPTEFSSSFTFPVDVKESFDEYVKENTKKPIVDAIIEMVMDDN